MSSKTERELTLQELTAPKKDGYIAAQKDMDIKYI